MFTPFPMLIVWPPAAVEPPIVIVPVVVAAPRVIVPAAVGVTAKFPVPTLITTPVAPVVLPTVIVRAPTVPKFTAAVSLSVARLRAVPAVLINALAWHVKRPVTVKAPGITVDAAKLKVIVDPALATLIWLVVPAMVMLPALGVRLLIVLTAEEPPLEAAH